MRRGLHSKMSQTQENKSLFPVSTHTSVLMHNPHSTQSTALPPACRRKGHGNPVEGASHLTHP